MEATGHEAEARLAKKAQEQQIRPMFARPGTRQGRGVEQPQFSGFDQQSMIALASSRILELAARLWKVCRRPARNRSMRPMQCGRFRNAESWGGIVLRGLRRPSAICEP